MKKEDPIDYMTAIFEWITSADLSDVLALFALIVSVITLVITNFLKKGSVIIAPEVEQGSFSFAGGSNKEDQAIYNSRYKINFNIVIFLSGNINVLLDCVSIDLREAIHSENRNLFKESFKKVIQPNSVEVIRISKHHCGAVDPAPLICFIPNLPVTRDLDLTLDLYMPDGNKRKIKLPISVAFKDERTVIDIKSETKKVTYRSLFR